jgi:hypothetical protein
LKTVSTKTFWHELHKSSIHGRIAIAKALITEGNARMQWCHDHKIWISDNWKQHMIWSDELSFTLFPTAGRVYVWKTPKKAYNMEYLVLTEKHRGDSAMVWAAISLYSILLAPLLPFMPQVLHGSTWTGWVIRCIPWSRWYFLAMQSSKTTMPPFTWLELFSRGLKSMKVYFSTFPGQHNHYIWTSMNHSVSFGDQSKEHIPTSNMSKATWRCSSRRIV